MQEDLYKVVVVYDDKEIVDINNITRPKLDEFMEIYHAGRLYWYGETNSKEDKAFSINKDRVKIVHAIKQEKRIPEEDNPDKKVADEESCEDKKSA